MLTRHAFQGKIGLLAPVAGMCLLTACSSVGPPSLHRDRLEYNDAVGASRKEMLLKNIVKLRYADSPEFLTVSSIVSGYNLETTAELGGDVFNVPGKDVFKSKAIGKYIDRPTINYSPVKGDDFTKAYLTPLSIKVFLTLLIAGTRADILFPLLIDTINGLRPRDADYQRVAELFRIIQRAGVLSAQVSGDTPHLIFRASNVSDDVARAYAELVRLLRLKRVTGRYRVGFGMQPDKKIEIALITRSVMTMMTRLARDIDVPEEHIAEGRAFLVKRATGTRGPLPRLIRVRESAKKPGDGFVTIQYRNHWYWIDDRDYESKRIFTFLMIFLTLSEGETEKPPLVTTISAG